MSNPLDWLNDALQHWDARGLRRNRVARSGSQRARFQIDGRNYLNFGANDYLGLAAEALLPAVRQSLDEVGWGAGASPLVTGHGSWHARLERELAAFEGTEAALLFPTGYAANMATIAALVGPEDAIFSDAKNHASIIDGCRLSGAQVHVYRHADADDLSRLLSEHAPAARRRLIVTDGLFSMDGDFAPLDKIAPLAEMHEAMLLVDEAHATGVIGAQGRGVSEHFSVEYAVPIRVGTLSKALGSHGGFVVGSQALVDWLANRARAYVFSTAAPEALAAAGSAALRIVREEPKRREILLDRSAELRTSLQAQGFDVKRSRSQIIPIVLGDAARTMQAAQALRDLGIWVPGIRPPSVPEGESLLRISLSYAHTEEMLAALQIALRAL
jgi:8-amino-7-oxononanoate synthase